jgi:predicted lipoprotein with Yx(FWY)xxD motif
MRRLGIAVFSAAMFGSVLFASPVAANPSPATAVAPGAVTVSGAASLSVQRRFRPQANIRIRVGNSAYGKMLFNRQNQAIYIFEKETTRKPRCYGACARAWPPVLTRGRLKGRPKALRGVRQRLLGTVRRRGGARQVTYNGKPLYYYRDELPRQVFCHNVIQYGANWAVIHPSGRIAD